MITLRIILTRALTCIFGEALKMTHDAAAEITRLRAALREIAEGEVSDHPIELRAFCRAELGEQQ